MKLHPTFTANAVSVFLFLFVAAAEVSASVSDAAQREERDLQLLGWDLPPYPTSRFTEWSSLGGTTQNEVASNLDYNQTSWNLPMTNEIEILSLESIQASGNAPYNTITRTLGLDEEQWDCWINHFYDYDWSELVDEELGLYFEALGWTQTSWDNDDAANFPESNDKFWVELTDLEKEAANYLCFFPELWDATLTIPEWTYDPVTGTGGTAVQPPTPSPAPSTPAPEIKKAKIAPPAKCGSLADAAGRGGAAAQAKDCTSRNGNGRKLRVKGSKRTTYYD